MKKHTNDPDLIVFRKSIDDNRVQVAGQIMRAMYLLRDAEFALGERRCEVLSEYIGDEYVHKHAHYFDGDDDGDTLRAWKRMCDAIADYLQSTADDISKE